MAAQFVGLNSTFDQQRQVINELSVTVNNVLTGAVALDNFSATGISTFIGPISFGTSAYFGDNDSLYFGASNDLQIYHSGSNSFIDEAGIGDLSIRGDNNILISSYSGNETKAKFITNGAVELYYDNSKKFETIGAGITVFGTTETQQLNVSGVSTFQGNVHLGDNDSLYFGDSDDLRIYHNGSDSYISDVGSGGLNIGGSVVSIKNSAQTQNYLVARTGTGAVELYNNNSKKFETTGIGVSIIGVGNTATITGPSNLVLDPGTVGDNTGAVTILGNLQVEGTQTVINSTTMTVNDLNITLADGAANASAANGAGITVDGASATLTYASTGDKWVFNKAPYYNTDRLLTTADEGTGNGIDADTVDGLEASQFLRSDADDTTTGQIQLTKANNTATGGGQIYLNGTTGNRIDFVGGGAGVAAPSFTTRSVGTKIVLYPQLNVNNADYAFGIENSTLWSSVPQATNSYQHRWYAGTTQLADLKGSGELVIGSTSLTGTASQPLQVSGGAYVSGNLGIGVTNPSGKLHISSGTSGDCELIIEADEDNNKEDDNPRLEFRQDGGQTIAGIGYYLGNLLASQSNVLSVVNNQTSGGGILLSASGGGYAAAAADVFIDTSGDVGIGTDNPTAKLDVNGTLNVTGVSTFQNNVHLGDNDSLYFGDGEDFEILHDSNNSVIRDKGTGSLAVQASGINFLRYGTSDYYAQFVAGGKVSLRFNGDTKFETTGAGVTVFGTTETQQLNVSGVATFQNNVNLGDNDKINLGDGNDLQIYHIGGSFNNIEGSAELRLQSASKIQLKEYGTSEVFANFIADGAVELYYDNSLKFETTGIGISVSNGASTSATIAGPSELIIDPAAVGDNTGLVRIKGDLYVDGTTTQINSTSLEIADFIVGIASTATTDLLADGAGIQIGPDNTFLYEYNGGTNPSLKSSENLNVASGKVYQIAETERLSANTLSLGTGTTIHSSASNVLSLGVNGKSNIRVENTGDVTLNLSTGYEDEGILKFGRQDATDRAHYIRVFNTGTASGNYMKFDVHDGTFSTGGLADTTTVLTLLGNGNVGIGTNAPLAPLHLCNITPIIRFQESDATIDNRNWNVGVNGQEFYWQAINDSGAGGANIFKMARVDEQINTFEGRNSGTTWFIVDNANRRIGVRTDIADAAFDVYGNSKFRDDVEFYGPSVGIASAIWDSSANLLNFKDNVKATFGDGNDGYLYFDSNNLILQEDSATGSLLLRGQNLRLQNPTNGNENWIEALNDGTGRTVRLFYNGSKKFETTGYGVTVSGGAYVSGIATITTIDVTNATIDNLIFTSGTAITSVDTDLTTVSGSDDTLASAKAIKAYVDNLVDVQDLDFAGDTGTGAVDLDTQSLTIAGTASEIETSASGHTLTIGLPNEVAITTSLVVGSATTITSSGIIAGIVTAALDNTLTLNTFGNGLSGSTTYNNSGSSIFTVASNATSVNTGNTIVYRDASGNFSAGIITASLDGNAGTATSLATARDFSVSGDVATSSGVSFDGTENVNLELSLSNTFNANTSGIITASNFVGNLTGTAITASNLTDGANITTGTIDDARLPDLITSNINIASGISSIATLDTTTGTIDYLEGTNISYSGIGTIHIAMIDQLSVSGVVTSSNGFTSGIGVTNPVQITVSGNTLIFNVVGVGSTSFTLFA